MEIKEIIQDLQTSLDKTQSKLNMLKTVQSGQLYEVDILMTRKEAAHFIKKSERQLDRQFIKHADNSMAHSLYNFFVVPGEYFYLS